MFKPPRDLRGLFFIDSNSSQVLRLLTNSTNIGTIKPPGVAMTRKEKRELKIRENTKNVSLEDFEWLINQHGYIKAGGSHAVAVIGNTSYPYPRKNPMGQPYVRRLITI
jgi:transcriptional regulator of heat shock response